MDEENKLFWLPSHLTRRQVVMGGGAAALAAGLAACGSDDKSSTATTTGGSTATTSAGSTATTAAGTTGDTTGTAAPQPTLGTTAGTEPSSDIKSGGTLRLGVVGGTNDIIDGQYIVAKPDQARLLAGWETLVTYDDKFQVSFDDGLAESIEAPSADRYIIKLRSGVEFHNGKTMGADDLVYSMMRLIDKDLGLAPQFQTLLLPTGIKKLDDLSVEITLTQKSVSFLDGLAGYVVTVVPDGYTREDAEQVGTGPFKLVSFTPGSESKHTKFANYRQEGKPYLDGVDIIDFADSAALVNALLAGQVDAIVDLPFAQVSTVQADSKFKILESQAGSFLPITMAVDQAPFDDVRVRQAMRLIVDREQMVERVLSGYGRVANDLYSPFDACYASDLPQRTQDIDKAKALLEEAGQSGLTIDLFAPNDTAGLADMAAVFADQAKAAGVTVNVQVLGSEYWGDEYCKRTFATSFWGTRPYLNQVAAGNLEGATYPETHWPPKGSKFGDEYNEALATVDQDARCKITHAMQEEEYNDGGNIIAFFNSLLDAHSESVKGLVGRPNVLNFDHFGRGFKEIWLDV